MARAWRAAISRLLVLCAGLAWSVGRSELVSPDAAVVPPLRTGESGEPGAARPADARSQRGVASSPMPICPERS